MIFSNRIKPTNLDVDKSGNKSRRSSNISRLSVTPSEKSSRIELNVISIEIMSIMTAIENWDLDEFIALKKVHMLTDINTLNVSMVDQKIKVLCTNFWKSLNKCNMLHYASVFRASRIMKYLLEECQDFDINAVTEEGVTALQISSALGDYFSVNLLLSHHADTSMYDKNGRTCMHYSVHSNIETCMKILEFNPDIDLTMKDSAEKTCFHYASDDILPFLQSFDKHDNKYWIPMNIKRYKCVNPIHRKDNKEKCICGQKMSDHDRNKIDCLPNDIVEAPTNAFGEIEFSGFYERAKYICISKSTELTTLIQLFLEKWQIKRPNIIMTIYGSDEIEIGHLMKENIKKGILKSIGSQGTCVWLVTSGGSNSITQVIGECVRDFIGAYGGEDMYALAIYPWCFHNNPDALINPSYSGRYPADYKNKYIENDTKYSEELETSHTHYIFVDYPTVDLQSSDNSEQSISKEYHLLHRINLESLFSNLEQYVKKDFNSTSEITSESIPYCGILVGGNREQLFLVYHSLIVNRKPLVVIKGTGGIANIIADILDDISEQNRKKKSIEEATSIERMEMLFGELWDFSPIHHKKEISMIQSIIENRHLLEIFSPEDSFTNDLDKKILSSLLSEDSSGSQSDLLNLSQLKVAVAINRNDIAKERIFIEGKKWKQNDLEPLMRKSIIDNKVEFVRLFIDKGFRIDSYVTLGYIEFLYNYNISTKPCNVLFQTFKECGIKYSSRKRINIDDIFQALCHILGETYKPKSLDYDSISNKFERPILELFIWSILTMRFELSLFLWTLEKEPMGAALFAAYLLRNMIRFTDVVSEREDLQELSNDFESKAAGVLDECYRENPKNTRENLIRILQNYGQMSLIELAAVGHSIQFISHRSCQQLLDMIWRHSLDDSSNNTQFAIGLLFGIIFPWALPMVMDYKPGYYKIKTEETTIKQNNNSYNESVRLSTFEVDERIEQDESFCQSIRPTKQSFVTYFKKIRDFYCAPVVKFSYSLFFYVIFIVYFSTILLVRIDLNASVDVAIYIFFIWTFILAFEEIRQAVSSGLSMKLYLNEIWNMLDLLAHTFFLIGGICFGMTFLDRLGQLLLFDLLPLTPIAPLKEFLTRFSRISFSISLFFFCVKVLQAFSINVNLGPKIVMIESMITNDLVPFLAIFIVFILSFGVTIFGITFQVQLSYSLEKLPIILYELIRTSTFQMFGDLRIDILTGQATVEECTKNNVLCPDPWGKWLSPLILMVFIVMCNIMMLNLLIAMFSNTYSIIQSSAKEHWTLQRYYLMLEYTDRPPVPAPFIILWLPIDLILSCFNGNKYQENAFRKFYQCDDQKEKQLIQWEHMRGLDYIRSFDERLKKRKKNTTVFVNRGGGNNASAATSEAIGSIKHELDLMRDELSQSFVDKFYEIDTKLTGFHNVELNVQELMEMVKELTLTCKTYHSTTVEFDPNLNQKTNTNNKRSVSALTKTNTSLISIDEESGSQSFKTTTKNKTNPFINNLSNGEKSKNIFKITIDDHILGRFVPIFNKESLEEDDLKNLKIDETLPPPNQENYLVNLHETCVDVGRLGLPKWGVNLCIHLIVSRCLRNDKGAPVKINNKPTLEILSIMQSTNQVQLKELPFYIIKHTTDCFLNSCHDNIVRLLLKKYIVDSDVSEYKRFPQLRDQDINALGNATVNEIYNGYVSDIRNTDNSWIETKVFNIHEIFNATFSKAFLKSLRHDKSESVQWSRLDSENWANKTYDLVFKKLVEFHNSFL